MDLEVKLQENDIAFALMAINLRKYTAKIRNKKEIAETTLKCFRNFSHLKLALSQSLFDVIHKYTVLFSHFNLIVCF